MYVARGFTTLTLAPTATAPAAGYPIMHNLCNKYWQCILMVHAAVLAVSVYCHCLPVRWIEAIHWRIHNERKQHANRERDLLMSRAGRRSTADDTTLIAMALHASATKLLLIWEWRVKQLFLLCWESGSGRRVSKWEWASKCVRPGKCISSAVARTGQRVRSAWAKRRLPKQNCKRSNKAKRIHGKILPLSFPTLHSGLPY